MTIREALQYGKSMLHAISATALLDKEILLCHTLHCTKELLIKEPDRLLKAGELRLFKKLIAERSTGKPIAYITHEKEFYGRNFYVDERVLIPRPETEEMVEEALHFLTNNQPRDKARGRQPTTIIDLGTGSGCIAISVALEHPGSKIIGLDISTDALAVARKNAKLLKCKNVKFLHSDLLSALKPKTYKLKPKTCILANLPYIGTSTNRFISAETHRFEPHLATFGGPDGLDLYRRTFSQIKNMNLNVAAMFMEIGWSQGEAIKKEALQAFPSGHVEIKHDLAGLPRMIIMIS